jgi:hypothetical protein
MDATIEEANDIYNLNRHIILPTADSRSKQRSQTWDYEAKMETLTFWWPKFPTAELDQP